MKRITAISIAILLSAGLLVAHGDYTHLMGTVSAISGDHIAMKDTAGKTVMIMTHKDTKYLVETKTVTAKDLKVGLRIVADVKMDAAMKMYKADQIQIGVAAPAGK